MKIVALLLATVISVGSMALAQSQSQQPQPADPTAQAPTEKAPAPKTSTTGSHPLADSARTLQGEVILADGIYYLRSGDEQYRIDDQAKAKQMAGQTVRVTGTVQGNEVHVKSIERR